VHGLTFQVVRVGAIFEASVKSMILRHLDVEWKHSTFIFYYQLIIGELREACKPEKLFVYFFDEYKNICLLEDNRRI
jgi:hypothetical protein